MYRYDDYDRALVIERVAQYRDQLQRNLAGELSEDEFRPLRLQNGLYLPRHAPMLRIAVPYGMLSRVQLQGTMKLRRSGGPPGRTAAGTGSGSPWKRASASSAELRRGTGAGEGRSRVSTTKRETLRVRAVP